MLPTSFINDQRNNILWVTRSLKIYHKEPTKGGNRWDHFHQQIIQLKSAHLLIQEGITIPYDAFMVRVAKINIVLI